MPKARPTNPDTVPAWAAELSDRERAFVEHYAVSLNAADAARKAGYSPKRASETARDLRRRPEIAAAIAELVEQRANVTGTIVLEQLGAIVSVDVTDVTTVQNGVVTTKDSADLTPPQRMAIAGIEVGERGNVNVKMHDRIRALELLAKVLGLKKSVNDTPTVAVQVNVNAAEAADRVMQRVDAMLNRLPAPAEQPMPLLIDATPIKDPAHVA